mgnify:CR=1 FL=1|jgi:peroxiredoxin
MIKKQWGVLLFACLLMMFASQHLKAEKDSETTEQKVPDHSALGENTVGQALPEKKEDRLPGLKIGEKAPDFTLPTLHGDLMHLSEWKGQKVIINFWATWCPPCKEEIPVLQSFYDQQQGSMKLLAVNIDPQANVSNFVRKYKITYPILLDKDDQVNKKYKVEAIPTTYVVDEHGIIIHKHIGSLNQQQIINWLK